MRRAFVGTFVGMKKESAMDESRFDAIVKSLATPRPRRAVFRALLGGIAAGAWARQATAAPVRTCSGNNLECPGKQICGFDDATQQVICKDVTGYDHSEFRVCKGEFEFNLCQRGSQCCVYPDIRDPGGISLVTNCCDNGLICDTQLGCVPRPGTA
jgi:hypothetical protein